MTDDTPNPLRRLGDLVATLLDGQIALLDSLRRTGHAEAVSAEHLVGLAMDVAVACGQIELAHAEAQAAALTQDAIRRASSGGA